MAKLNYEWISGSIPRNILQQNKDAFASFSNHFDQEDGFIHLLGKMTAAYPVSGELTYSVNAPYQFFYIYEGSLCISLNQKEYTLQAGNAALLPADGITTLKITKARCQYFHMYLCGMALVKYESILSDPFHYPVKSSSGLFLSRFLDHMNALSAAEPDFLFVAKTSMWINDLLTEMVVYKNRPATKKEAPPKYLIEIRNMLETHYVENYTLEYLEDTYSVSKYRICREFAKYYKKSPIQFLNHIRIENAKRLLLTTDTSIHEVGNLVGIPNTNHFINLFKRETGATPLAFKQDAPVSISELHYL